MNTRVASTLLAAGFVWLHAQSRAADSFSVRLHDGDTWSFLESGNIVRSDGSSERWGPERNDIHIEAVNVQILDHHADWRIVDGDSRFTGIYLAQTAAGLMRVSDGNPVADAVYRYYTDPAPWIYLTQAFEVGQTFSFSGQRRGRWTVPGGGFETWSGTWRQTWTHLGTETVTTPLGTFDALKLDARSVTTTDQRTVFPNATNRSTWDELRWYVAGLGFIKATGSGIDESDWDSDGVIDSWQRETLTLVAVPEPASVWCWLAGLTLLAQALRRRLRASAQSPNATLTPIHTLRGAPGA